MKRIISIILSLGLLTQLVAVELNQATNEQLLGELNRRLTGTSPSPAALAVYSCDSSYYLKIEVFAPNVQNNRTLYTGTNANCNTQQNTLSAHKSKIDAFTLIAACDSSGYLRKFPLNTDGTIGQDTSAYIGDVARCISQATAINTGN